jgi:ABC transport system ATP-binding/permease protein
VVRKLVSGPHREPDFRDRALLERFWFDTTAQYAPVRMLSGGERRRLQLVMVLATEPNLLILDEPTNDLDLDTLRSLEAFLDDWPGALVVASHDRAFLDRVADHVLAIDPGGSVRRVPGGVAGWLAERSNAPAPKSTPATAAAKPAAVPKAKGAPSQYTVGRQLRETEQAMAKAQKRVDQLTAELATIDHAAVDHTELSALGTELAAAQADLDDLESRWLELAELQHG